MNIIKNYSIAVLSSNLRDDAHHHATDVLAAVALSGKLGSKLYRVKYCNDASSYSNLLDTWIEIVSGAAKRRNWPKESRARKVATLSLEHYLKDICLVCKGRGHVPHGGIDRVLSDEVCPCCNGTAKKRIEAPHAILKYVQEMVEMLESTALQASDSANRRLSQEFHL